MSLRSTSPGRLAAVVLELQELLHLLQRTAAAGRPQVFARCIPLLSEGNALNRPPLDVRRVKALIQEASWHLRSLAGLATTNLNKDEEHAAWALASLEALARCAEQGDAAR